MCVWMVCTLCTLICAILSELAAPSSWGIDLLVCWLVEALNSAMLALSAYTLFIDHRLVDVLLAIAGLRVLFDALSEHFWRRRRSQDFVFLEGCSLL